MNIDDRLENDLIPDEESVLSTDDEELNDETFGVDNVGTDFDFHAGGASFQEVEAQMKSVPAKFQQFSLEQVEAAMRAMKHSQMREGDDKYHNTQASTNRDHYPDYSSQKPVLDPLIPTYIDQQRAMLDSNVAGMNQYSRSYPYQSMPQNYSSIQMQMQEHQMKMMQEQQNLRLMQEHQFKAMQEQQFRAIQEQQAKLMQEQQLKYMSMMQEQHERARQEQQTKSMMQEQQLNIANMMQERYKHAIDIQEQQIRMMQEQPLNFQKFSGPNAEALGNTLLFDKQAPPAVIRDELGIRNLSIEDQGKRRDAPEKKKPRETQERQVNDGSNSKKQLAEESGKSSQKKSKKSNEKKSKNEQPTPSYQILKRPDPEEAKKSDLAARGKTSDGGQKDSDDKGPVQKEIDFEELQKGVSLDSENFPELGKAPKLDGKAKIDRPKTGGGEKPRRGSRIETNFFFSDTANRVADEDPDAHLPSEVRNKGLMRKFEQELIAKIQISNLVSDDPYADDYYYQIYSLLKQHPDEDPVSLAAGGLTWQQSLLTNQLVTGKGNSVTVSNQMEKQMKRLIEGRKQKAPREGTLSLEGALGKISVTTVRNPKKAIQIEPTSSKVQDFSKKLSKITVLQSIESVYSVVLALEQLKRIIPDESAELEEWFYFLI